MHQKDRIVYSQRCIQAMRVYLDGPCGPIPPARGEFSEAGLGKYTSTKFITHSFHRVHSHREWTQNLHCYLNVIQTSLTLAVERTVEPRYSPLRI
jgi:hypothetical protein